MGCGFDEASKVTEFEGPFGESQCSICLHSFADLSHVSPAAFMYLLKECYIYGMVLYCPFFTFSWYQLIFGTVVS